MFNNIALDVFIGLVFVFLLYSLLTTIIMEFIAHYMSLRARLLVKALRRMLEDNQPEIFGINQRITALDFFSDFKEAVKRYFMPFKNLPFLQRFYLHPTVRYLGESRSSSKPSYLQASNFSQTIIQLFRGDSKTVAISQIAEIENFLFKEAPQILGNYERHKHWIVNDEILKKYLADKTISFESLIKKLKAFRNNPVRYNSRKLLLDQLITALENLGNLESIQDHRMTLAPILMQVKEKKISADTLMHFQNLFIDAQNDLEKFRQRLESWFDQTMDRTAGWYKRQTQVILLCLGFGIAIFANVDTLKIYKTLAKDKRVRDQLVNMAIQSQEKYAAGVDNLKRRAKSDSTLKSRSGRDSIKVQKIIVTTGDSILDQTYKLLEDDVSSAGTILGMGWCSSDSCKVYKKLELRCDSLKNEFGLLEELYNREQDGLKKIIDNSKDSLNKATTEKNLDSMKKSNAELIKKRKDEIETLSKNVSLGYQRYKDRWDGWSFVGWLITALAISLGAPFWFDLLNKLIKLRSSGATVTSSDTSNNTGTMQSAPPVTLNVNTNTGEQAVG